MRVALFVAGFLLFAFVVMPPARADSTCGEAVSLDTVGVACKSDGDQLAQDIASAPSGVVYDVRIKCVSGAGSTAELCANPITCDVPPGSVRYDVLRSDDGGQTYVKVSEACLVNPPDGSPPVVTPGLVAQQFEAIAWPASPLEVQPPGGRTLVNLATNFYTTNTAPQTRTVTLLGQQVDIEATPTSWTWVHGDGTSQASDGPGAAYPDLTITHTYTDADVTLSARVDTTYAGRFRVNGGAWAVIPTTVTIAGEAAALEVVPAAPQLVAAD